MHGTRVYARRDVVGPHLQNSVLMTSVRDSAKPESIPLSQSSPCMTVSEIQELGVLESDKLSVKGAAIRPQLSADAALLTKMPASKGKRLPLRRTVTESAVWPSSPRQSIGREIQHAAAETWLITRLTFSLLSYLGLGYRWITKLMALGLYAILLMPGFVQIGYDYFFSKYVYRSITYGSKPRNRLDLYLPEDRTEPKTVVIFVTGGAWVIGYKAWGSLLGQQLVERDIIVACIDYRNFPQGKMEDMVEDISTGISFVVNNVEYFGGDPNRIFLAGQSAGAHLAAHTLVRQAKKESRNDNTVLTWRSSDFKAFIGISGGYNLYKLVNHFHKRGLYRSIFVSMVDGEENLVKFSPDLEVLSPFYNEALKYLPHIALFHGDADYSIPSDASVSFAESLRSVGVSVTTRVYPGKTHTDLILQDPMRGGVDELLEDVLVVLGTPAHAVRPEAAGRRRLVPEILLQLARLVSPF